MKIQQITRYIEKKLRKEILDDVKPSKKIPTKITNERDLESSIYFHLRQEIGKTKKFKISTNYSVHGYRKKGASDTSQMMPDVVVLEWISDFEKPKINLMMELKIMEPKEPLDIDRDGFKTIIKNEFVSDFRKLNTALKKGWTDSAYFVYLYHSPTITQKKMENLIKKQAESGRTKMRFTPIAINKFTTKKKRNKKNPTRTMLASRHKARQLYSSRPEPNDDPDLLWKTCKKCGKLAKIHTDRDNRKCNPDKKIKRQLSRAKRSKAAKAAGKTRKRKEAKRREERSAAAKRAARTRKRRSSQ